MASLPKKIKVFVEYDSKSKPWQYDKLSPTFSKLTEFVSTKFPSLILSKFALIYNDENKDSVSITDDKDLVNAIQYISNLGKGKLKIFVVVKKQQVFKNKIE